MGKNKSGYINSIELAKETAIEALKLYKKQERENIKKNKLHNTGLLLDHYFDFVDHYEKIKYKASDIIDELDPVEVDMVSQDDIIIYSIKRSKIRTKIMINQIETAVKMVQAQMKAKNEIEKYNVFVKLYMDRDKKDLRFNQRVKSVAEESNCGESSVRRWSSEILNELSIKIFGVDGLRLEI